MILKKIINTVISTVLMGSCVLGNVSIVGGGMAADAANSYDPLDVNRDNTVNVADVVYLDMYLVGKRDIADYNRLDVNGSLTVDKADSNKILAKVAMTTYSSAYFSRKTNSTVSYPNVLGFTSDAYADSTKGRTYRRYSYAKGKELGNYTLYPPSSSQPSATKIIDDEDTRYFAYGEENTGIVRISTIGGTGFIVGDHQIATAAHCVYNGKWVSMSINTYDSNGCMTNKTLTPVEAHIPKNFEYGNRATDIYDYALITVAEDLSDYVQFSLGTSYNVTSSNFSTVPLYVTGSPSSVANVNNSSHRLYSEEGHVMGTDNKSLLHYDVDTTEGDSGAPVYTITCNTIGDETSYVYTALAVHHGGLVEEGNWGSLVTKYHLQFYKDNNCMSY